MLTEMLKTNVRAQWERYLNKYMLSSHLNKSTNGATLVLIGSTLHAVGPVMLQECSPKMEHV